ncbi:HIRAN domain-containing protein [Fibrella forsythiae]|uniref:HIRAN domain-containing protein n=1 Tax=Fibrella forsythiae TaxID=2817061 RepID=A0ABS3JJ64_9BACT|nr:HIRAN domain-containing protein [Fibrella forsythiae]MBO0949456.1 HIRAN domain-containing protein [Fibrella forsythiae]
MEEVITICIVCGLIIYLLRSKPATNSRDSSSLPTYPTSDRKTSTDIGFEPSLVSNVQVKGSGKKKSSWKGFRTDIAGIKHHDAPKIINSLKVGEMVSLVREPNNQFDTYAVKVMYKKYFLGYISAEQVQRVAQSIDDGETISAEIARVYVSPHYDVEHGHFMQVAIFINKYPQDKEV